MTRPARITMIDRPPRTGQRYWTQGDSGRKRMVLPGGRSRARMPQRSSSRQSKTGGPGETAGKRFVAGGSPRRMLAAASAARWLMVPMGRRGPPTMPWPSWVSKTPKIGALATSCSLARIAGLA